MDDHPLKRRMLENPSTGSYHGHPQPHPSQLTSFRRDRNDTDNTQIDSQMQSQLNQAVNQLAGSSGGQDLPKVHAAKEVKDTKKPEPPPPKPVKPVILPPQQNKPQDSPQFTPTVKSDIAQQIKEEPIAHPKNIGEDTELDQIKKLPVFRPVVIGTVLFIAGLIVSAIIAIALNII